MQNERQIRTLAALDRASTHLASAVAEVEPMTRRSRAVAGCDVILIATRALKRRLEAGDLDVSAQLTQIRILIDRAEKTVQDARKVAAKVSR